MLVQRKSSTTYRLYILNKSFGFVFFKLLWVSSFLICKTRKSLIHKVLWIKRDNICKVPGILLSDQRKETQEVEGKLTVRSTVQEYALSHIASKSLCYPDICSHFAYTCKENNSTEASCFSHLKKKKQRLLLFCLRLWQNWSGGGRKAQTFDFIVTICTLYPYLSLYKQLPFPGLIFLLSTKWEGPVKI